MFNEKVIQYFLYKESIKENSKVFFNLSYNFKVNENRNWCYYTGTDVDLLKITEEDEIIAYEIKGMRKDKGNNEPPRLYEGLDQALGYLNLPFVMEDNNFKPKFNGGSFDFVYLVHARNKIDFSECEKRVFSLVPVGFILITTEGKFEIVKEAIRNPLQIKEAKEHLLNHLNTLNKFSTESKIFKKIREEFKRQLTKIKND